jgi:hypothetical protein
MLDTTLDKFQSDVETMGQNTDNYLEGLARQDEQQRQLEREAVNDDPFDSCYSYSPANSDC